VSDPSEYRGVRVLVLGASGFIGRWVARELSRRGARLVLAVRDPRAFAHVQRAWGIEGEVREVDLSRSGSGAALVRDVRPALAFDLAGYGVDPRERDEELARRLNAELAGELASALASARDPAWLGQELVRAGSALEFGGASGALEDPWSCAPTTVYGRTKLDGSRALARVASETRLRALTARLFTVYGPGEHEGRLLPSLLAAARTSARVPLTAGEQRRDFTYVEDVARGLVELGLVRLRVEPCALNLATGTLASVREFVETAARELGIASERLRFGALPTRPEEMAHDPVSVAGARALLGWTPATPIAEGVRRTRAFA